MDSKSYSLTIRRVKLENFLSHRNSDVLFSEGVNVIIGENGAGKSSILEAIFFAFSGNGWRVDTIDDLINRNFRSARVILEFDYMKESYRIESELGDDRKVFLFKNDKMIAEGSRKVKEILKELLGFDSDKLKNVVIVEQGGLTELFTQTRPADRKAIIDKLLGLNVYEEVGKKLEETCIQVSEDIGPICAKQKGLEDRIEAIRKRFVETHIELLNERKEREKAIAEYESRIQALKNKIIAEKLREKILRLEEVARRRDELLQTKSRLEERISRLSKEKKDTEEIIFNNEKILEEIVSELRKLEEITALAPLSDKFESLLKTLAEIKNKRQILEIKTVELRKLDSLEPRYHELKEKYESLDALEKTLIELHRKHEEARKRFEDLNSEISRERGFVEKLKSDIERARNALVRLINEVQIDEKEALTNRSYLDRVREEALSALNRVKMELQNLIKSESIVKNQLNDYENKISILEKSTESKCPVCERPLDENHRRKLLQDMKKLAEEARFMLSKLQRDRKQVEDEELPVLEKRLRVIEEIKQVAQLFFDNQHILKEHEENINKLIKDRTRLEQHLQDLENNVKIVERELVEWQNLSKIYDIKHHVALRKEVETLRQEVKVLEEEAELIKKELSAKVGVPFESFDSLIESIGKKLREANEAERKLDQLKYRRESMENNIRMNQEKLREVEKELKLVEIELEKIRIELDAVEKEFQSLKKSEEELSKLESEIKTYEALIHQHRLEKEKIEKELEKLREKVTKVNDAIKKILILYWLKNNVFYKDGLPKYMRTHYVEVMSRVMESLSDVFDLGFESIQIDEEYGVKVSLSRARGEPFSISQLSGGEKVAISILALLALHQIVTQGRIGFLALDEPTEYLDEERRRELVELLRKFKSGERIPQIIVVTHDNELIEAANVVHKVVKNGFSRILREGDEY